MADEMETALLVRRRVFDLTAGLYGFPADPLGLRLFKLRGLFIGIGKQVEAAPLPPPYTQRLFVVEDSKTLFLMLWDGDDTRRLIGAFERGEWEKKLLP